MLNKRSPYLFFVKFFGCFSALYFFLPFYRGLIGIGGKMYFPYFENHYNLIVGFTNFLTSSARLILNIIGFEVFQKNYHSLRIGFSKGVSVNPSCLGWAVLSFWVAFVFADKGLLKHKLKWMLIGVISINLLNISRIVLITIANHLRWKPITSLDHHQTFNVASYFCVVILVVWYIRIQKRYESTYVAPKRASFTLSSIQ